MPTREVNGAQIYYEEQGAGAETIVFLGQIALPTLIIVGDE